MLGEAEAEGAGEAGGWAPRRTARRPSEPARRGAAVRCPTRATRAAAALAGRGAYSVPLLGRAAAVAPDRSARPCSAQLPLEHSRCATGFLAPRRSTPTGPTPERDCIAIGRSCPHPPLIGSAAL